MPACRLAASLPELPMPQPSLAPLITERLIIRPLREVDIADLL